MAPTARIPVANVRNSFSIAPASSTHAGLSSRNGTRRQCPKFREMRSKKCEAATSESNHGNANLPIGDGAEGQNANREIGVPGASTRADSAVDKPLRHSDAAENCFVNGS